MSRGDQRVLRWFVHVERMDEYRKARRVLRAQVSGGRARGYPELSRGLVPRQGWMDGVKVALGNTGILVEAVRNIGKSGRPWCIYVR